MGSEQNSSPSGKRSRDPEDELYLDNLHSHKRYLSEIMASSLNGLTVGDPIPDNLIDSQARTESIFYLRDDLSVEYSPMSEDSDDSRYLETHINASSSQPDSSPTSPVSPYRHQRFTSTASTSSSHPSHGCALGAPTSSQARQRGSESESRFPSSPSDICHSADLRRAALLRSLQMRTQPTGLHSSYELPFGPEQDPMHNEEADVRPCSFLKTSIEEREFQIGECSSSSMGIVESDFERGKSCRVLNMSMQGEE